ncbi:MAG: hypothetical protein QME81_13685 [bacterium]|nr:hypothetical protein [bacterium]
MPKALELRKVMKLLAPYDIHYAAKKGRHPKFVHKETGQSYPVKAHGKKTMILPYALNDLIDKFNLPADIFG